MKNDQLWPGWNTVRLIGRGSFGSVYEIERDVFDHIEKAALKVITIPPSNSDIEELYSDGYDTQSITLRFESYLKDVVKEYSLMSGLKGHTNIVYCDDLRYIQHDDGIGWDVYIKMELLTPMTKLLGKEISEKMVLKLALDVCDALILCKKNNIVHRDIKPQNIFVSNDGDFKLGDFGIAKVAERTTSGTKTGTYKYMAPEVYNNQPYGSAADIYSLGMVLYWLLNERRTPFLPLPPVIPSASEETEAINRRLRGELLPPPTHGSGALQRIVLKACAFDPASRYSSGAEMRRDLVNLIRSKVNTTKSAEGQLLHSDYKKQAASSGEKTIINSQKESQAAEYVNWYPKKTDAGKNTLEPPSIPHKGAYYKLFRKKFFCKRTLLYGLAVMAFAIISFGVLSGIINLVLSPIRNYRDVEISEEKSALANITESVLTEYDFTEGFDNSDASDTLVTDILQNASSDSPGKMEPIVLMGQTISTDITELDLTDLVEEHDVVDAVSKLGQLPKLENVTLNDSLTLDQVSRLQNSNVNATFQYSFTLFGEELSTLDTEVIFENQNIGDSGVEQIRQALSVLDNCDRFVLDNCGISSSLLADVREDFRSGPKVVWRVWFGGGSALTDVEVIRCTYDLVDDNCEDLIYCEDVRFMDIGHNEYLDAVPFVAGMPNLEYIIVSGAPIKDLTPFENCKKLKFLEIAFCEYIEDLSPLAGCESLEMLNISNTHVTDLSPLDDLPLTHLCARLNPAGGSRVPKEEQERFIEQHPDCWSSFTGSQPYGVGWRYEEDEITPLPQYALLQEVFNYSHTLNNTSWYLQE